MRQLADRIAVVTGSASGIGRATALALAREGCDLALADVDEVGMAETASKVRELDGPTAGDHSLTLIFAALMTGAHFSISVLR